MFFSSSGKFWADVVDVFLWPYVVALCAFLFAYHRECSEDFKAEHAKIRTPGRLKSHC